MVFPIISILEKFNVMIQSKIITVILMISSSKSVIQKIQECREVIIFSDIIERVNKFIDDNDIDELMLPRKIKRKDNNQHINIEEFYRRDYYRIIDRQLSQYIHILMQHILIYTNKWNNYLQFYRTKY